MTPPLVLPSQQAGVSTHTHTHACTHTQTTFVTVLSSHVTYWFIFLLVKMDLCRIYLPFLFLCWLSLSCVLKAGACLAVVLVGWFILGIYMVCDKDKNNRQSVFTQYLFNSILFLGFSIIESWTTKFWRCAMNYLCAIFQCVIISDVDTQIARYAVER